MDAETKIPEFLEGVRPGPADHRLWMAKCRNWREFQQHLRSFSEEQLRALMVIELGSLRRARVLERMRMRHSVLAGARHQAELERAAGAEGA